MPRSSREHCTVRSYVSIAAETDPLMQDLNSVQFRLVHRLPLRRLQEGETYKQGRDVICVFDIRPFLRPFGMLPVHGQ